MNLDQNNIIVKAKAEYARKEKKKGFYALLFSVWKAEPQHV